MRHDTSPSTARWRAVGIIVSDVVKKTILSVVLSIPSAILGLVTSKVFEKWGILTPFSEWLGNWLKMHVDPSQAGWTIAGITTLAAYGVLLWFVWRYHRNPRIVAATLGSNIDNATALVRGADKRPKIDIRFDSQHPYETSEISQNQVLNTVSVGLKNTGDVPASNCKVYIESIAPMPSPFYGGTPIQIDGSGVVLRADDPEKLVSIGGKWGNSTKYRFLAPHGAWAESLNYIECGPERAVEIKIVSTECTETALFMIKCNGNSTLCMKRVR